MFFGWLHSARKTKGEILWSIFFVRGLNRGTHRSYYSPGLDDRVNPYAKKVLFLRLLLLFKITCREAEFPSCQQMHLGELSILTADVCTAYV